MFETLAQIYTAQTKHLESISIINLFDLIIVIRININFCKKLPISTISRYLMIFKKKINYLCSVSTVLEETSNSSFFKNEQCI